MKDHFASRAGLPEKPSAHLVIEDLDAACPQAQALFTICIRSGPAPADATGEPAPSARLGG